MRIYIVGSVASGKSTLARRISRITNIPCCHLDEVVYEEDPSSSWGDRKRSPEDRDALFHAVLERPDFIMEDAGRECFFAGMEQADQIVLLEIPLYIRRKRILTRWLKQNLGLEPCVYKPHFDMLKAMFQWAKNYDTGADGTKKRIEKYKEKTVVLRCNRDIKEYLKMLPRKKEDA